MPDPVTIYAFILLGAVLAGVLALIIGIILIVLRLDSIDEKLDATYTTAPLEPIEQAV
jgi:hypothetical protein